MRYVKLGKTDLADARGVSMTEVSLAWLLTKTTSPVVGATKPEQIVTAARAVELSLSSEEIKYLEKAYVPHPLTGVMAQNRPTEKKMSVATLTTDRRIRMITD